MSQLSYALSSEEKTTQVMVGTPDMLLWGDLITKQQVRMSIYLNTLAEDFIPLHRIKMLFMAPAQQVAPVEVPTIFVKQEEILLFLAMHDTEPLPDETETRKYGPIEVFVGSYHIEGQLLKSPFSTLENMLMVSRAVYLPIYEATVRHVAKPWLGTFSATLVQVRRDRLIVCER
jgi:hypothetical protein